MKKSSAILSLSAVIAVGWVSIAMAGTVAYTSSASFSAAVAGTTTYGFEGIADPHGAVLAPSFAGGGGATFTPAGTGSQFVIGINNTGFGQSDISEQFGTPHGGLISLASATKGFGFDIGSNSDASTAISVVLSNGDSFSLAMPASKGTLEFFGFSDDTAFNSITITGGGVEMDIANYSIAPSVSPAAVPEPASMTILLSALGTILAARRKS